MILAMCNLSVGYPSHTELSMGWQDSSSEESMDLRALNTWLQCISQPDSTMQSIYKNLQMLLQSARENSMQLLPANCCLQLEYRVSKHGDHTSTDYSGDTNEYLSLQIMTRQRKMVAIRVWNSPKRYYKKSNMQN